MNNQASEMVMYKEFADYFYSKLPKGNILDIGCCDGKFGMYKPVDTNVYGIDIELSLLDKACVSEYVLYGNAEKAIPFNNGFFDGVFCRAVMEHVRDYDTFMKEINRTMKIGGTLILTCALPSLKFWNDYDHYLPKTTDGLKRMCKDYGFRVKEIHYEGSIPLFGILKMQHISIRLCDYWIFKRFRTSSVIICEKIREV